MIKLTSPRLCADNTEESYCIKFQLSSILLSLLQRLVQTRFSWSPKGKGGNDILLSLCYTLKLIGSPILCFLRVLCPFFHWGRALGK